MCTLFTILFLVLKCDPFKRDHHIFVYIVQATFHTAEQQQRVGIFFFNPKERSLLFFQSASYRENRSTVCLWCDFFWSRYSLWWTKTDDNIHTNTSHTICRLESCLSFSFHYTILTTHIHTSFIERETLAYGKAFTLYFSV